MRRSILLLFWIGLLPNVAFAELIPECSDPRYIESQATMIVQGEVVDVHSRKEENGHIYTFVSIKVSQYLRGQGPETITIKQLGGRIEENGETIEVRNSISPEFKTGETGYFYLDQPDTPFYSGQFYTTVCASGVKISPLQAIP